MDLWVVAAATAAGYITKHLQNLSRDRDSLSDLSSNDSNIEKPESPTCPFRRLARKMKLDKDVSTDRRKVLDQRYGDVRKLDGGSEAEVASTSGFGGENLGSLGHYESCNVLSISSLPPGLLPSEFLEGNEPENGFRGDIGDRADISGRNKHSLRTKHSYRHLVKPQNSLESCLVAQLYQKQTEMEEYVLSCLPSASTPTMRPLFVTDGSRIISRASGEFYSNQIRTDRNKQNKEAYWEKKEFVIGVPPLPKVGSLCLPEKMNKTAKGSFGRLSSSSKFTDGSLFHSQDGSQDGAVLFCLGISIGIISSFISNRREVDKLKGLLKQKENLVQDLHDELEMKDSLTVKELINENFGSQDTNDKSFSDKLPTPLCLEQNIDNSTEHDKELYGEKQNIDNSIKHDDKELYDDKAEEDSDSMSKIEAELEAEFERMGLNMNTSTMDRRLSGFVELDPDFEAVFAQGELRADMVERQDVDKPESDQDASGTDTTHSGNYAVSPRELSLRLHEVIQSRLEERVKDLEAALENSKRKVQLMDSDSKISRRKFSNSELNFSSTGESPIDKEDCSSMAEPLVMNLSGEALYAYNEAYEELMKLNESEEDDSPSGLYENNHHLGSHSFDGLNASLPHPTWNEELISTENFSSQGKTSENPSIQELLDGGLSEDEKSDCDDEMEQLIKQIVDKAKKGHPVLQNAQMFLMDKNGH